MLPAQITGLLTELTIILHDRGTLSIDDVATDLACEPLPFDQTLYWDDAELAQYQEELNQGQKQYQVHGGMFEIAQSMGGSPSSPVTRAVAKALAKNHDYCTRPLPSSCRTFSHRIFTHIERYIQHHFSWHSSLLGWTFIRCRNYFTPELTGLSQLNVIPIVLGAGIASLLGILWSNPTTSLTSNKSGLPAGRQVKVYGFAPPWVHLFLIRISRHSYPPFR